MLHIIWWSQTHYTQLVALGAALCSLGWAIEKVLEVIGTMTKNQMVDNLGVALANLLKKFNAKPPTT